MNYTKTDRQAKVFPACVYPFTCERCGERFPKGSWMFWYPVWEGKRRLGKGICRSCVEKGN